MNNAKFLGKTATLTLVLVGFGLAVYSFASPPQQIRQQQAGGFSYAELRISGNDVTWNPGGNDIPRTRTLTTVYRELGGNSRVSRVNLFNAIGEDGWEMVQFGENVWTFKKSN